MILVGRAHPTLGLNMAKEFHQIAWDDQLQAEWGRLLRLAIDEDLGPDGDWTTRALVGEDVMGRADVVARRPGVVAGIAGVEMTLREIEPRLNWLPDVDDGRSVESGERIGRIEGPARGMLTAERIVLNLLGHLSGIATLTRRFVDAVAETDARIYDTRKTTPGWRRLEKYAVRCGGGRNHRTGLFEAVLIKDNHLALGSRSLAAAAAYSPAGAVTRARQFIREDMIVEVEVDTLDQLDDVLPAGPDIVLLDNMSPVELREAVSRRDASASSVELEASGGVSLETVRRLALSGVDRISVGALTHSAACLDIGLDWHSDDVANR